MSSAFVIAYSTLEHPKNWLIVLSEYEIILFPDTTVPEVVNPIVESTVITDAPRDTFSTTFVFGEILKSPWIWVFSSNPT